MNIARTVSRPAGAGLLLAIILATAPAAAQAPPAAGAVQIKRPNLVVSDMDRALRVYRDILGFKVFALDPSGPESYSYPVFQFPKNAKLRMATLSTDTAVRILALTELKGAPLPSKPVPHRDAVVIEVQGIARIIERVKAEGLHVVPPKTSKTPEGMTFIEQAFEDYDGHLIVLYEIVKS
jgi:catechol 2,3-dioxygenase-like lactoylglutathione lyase family enzyme